jgi:phage gp45-like
MIRAIINAVSEGKIKLFAAAARIGESFANREYFQHYGFSSRPLKGAEGILIKEGNHIIMIASDDRRYRIKLEEGEVALYSDEGDHVHLKRGRVIEVETETLLIKAKKLTRIESPQVEATGKIIDMCDSGGKSMDAMRTIYTGHDHGNVQNGPGTTGKPNQVM